MNGHHTRMIKAILAATLIATGVTVSTPAHAWFFFFIPLGLFTDKGDTCISSSTKVGDAVGKPDGSTVIVKSIWGASSKCANPGYPVLAEVEKTARLPDNVSQARINLPEGWVQQKVTDEMKTDGVVMYSANRILDAGIIVWTYKRSAIANTPDFVKTRQATQLSRLKESERFPIEQVTIGGLPAWRYEVRGRVPAGTDVKYLSTFVEGTNEIVGVISWASAAGFDSTKPTLAAIADSISGLTPLSTPSQAASPAQSPQQPTTQGKATNEAKPNGNASTASPTQSAAPSGSSDAAQKLRELNNLHREGVITKEEFESKKKQILDSM